MAKSQKDWLSNLKFPKQPDGTENQIPEFYANMVQVYTNAFELELKNLLVDSQQNVKGAINIRMSPQTALTLSNILADQLRQYEELFGEIPTGQG